MAVSLNRAQLIGNLTKDPESRQTPNGANVCSFSVATNYAWKDANGEKKEKVEFHNIVAWGKLAEICQQFFKKGKKVFVEGRIQTRDWEGDDGVKRYKTEIVAENAIIMSPREDGEQRPYTPQTSRNESSNKNSDPSEQVTEEEISIDDLPF